MRTRLVAVGLAAVALLVAVASPASASGYVAAAWVTASHGSILQVAAYLSGAGEQVSWAGTGGNSFVVAELSGPQQPGAITPGNLPPNVIETNTWGMAMSEVWPTGATFAAGNGVTINLRQAGGSVWSGPAPTVKCLQAGGVIGTGTWSGAALGGSSVATYTLVGVGNCGSGIVYSVSAPEYSLNWAMRMHKFEVFNAAAAPGVIVGAQLWVPEAIPTPGLPVVQFDYLRGTCLQASDASCSGLPKAFVPGVDLVCKDGSSGGYVALLGGVFQHMGQCTEAHGGLWYVVRGTVADATGSWPGFRYYYGDVPLRTAIMCAADGGGPTGLTLAEGTGSPAPFVVCPAGRWAYSVIVSEPVSGALVVTGFYRDWAAHVGAVPSPVVPVPTAPPTPEPPGPSGCVDLGCVADSVSNSVYNAVNGTTQAIYNLVICNEECQNFDALAKPMDQWAVKMKPWLDQITWVGGSFAPLTSGCGCGGFKFTLHMPGVPVRIGPPGPGIDHEYEILNTCSGWAATLAATSRAGTSVLLVLGTGAACIRLIAAAFSFVGLIDDTRGKE